MKTIFLLATSLTLGFAKAQNTNPVDPTKFDHPVKVACVGDSITAGYLSSCGLNYPNQLQSLLGDGFAVSNYGVGEAMVPFYRQLLQPMNLFYTKRQNIGDQIFYGQRKGTDLGTAVLETLELLEKTGGPNAFVNIKSYVPVYESCMQ